MGRPRHVPWVAIQIDTLDSPKLALPSDTAILGWVAVLLKAKTQRRMGVFDSERHFRLVMGRFGRFYRAYFDARLLEPAASMCERCEKWYPDVGLGDVVVHDYRVEQRDPTAAERQEKYANGRETHGVSDELLTDDSRALSLSLSTVSRSSEEGSGEKPPEDDHLETWYRLMASWPKPAAVQWLNQIAADHGSAQLSRMLAVEWGLDSDRATLISRTRDRLDRDAHAADKAVNARRAKNAADEVAAMETMPEEQRTANLAKLKDMMVSAGLVKES